MLLCFFRVFLLSTIVLNSAEGYYVVPRAKFEVFYPRGFQVSIPAEDGVTLFAFHGKLNEEMEGLEAGHWSMDITKPRNGRFTFRDRGTALKVGDIIYYWTYALHYGSGYREDNGEYKVTGYVNKTDDVVTFPSSPSPSPETCKPSVTYVNGVKQECANVEIFAEDFSSRTIDPSKWTQQRRFSREPDYEFVTYLLNDDILYTESSNLFIKPKRLTDIYGENILRGHLFFRTDCTGEIRTKECDQHGERFMLPPIASGQVTTKNHFSFKYGSVKIRAKLPNMKWAFPQFFLDPSENAYGSRDYSSGQMRVAFFSESDPLVLSGGAILASERKFRNLFTCENVKKSGTWSADFHIFSLEWTPDSITTSVDGIEYCLIEPGNGFGYAETAGGEKIPNAEYIRRGGKMAPFDHEFHLTIGLGVGGHYDFDDNISGKPWINREPRAHNDFWNAIKGTNYPQGKLIIDYVKVLTV